MSASSPPKWSPPLLLDADDALPALQDGDLETLDEHTLDPWSDLFASTVSPAEPARAQVRPTLRSVVLDPVAEPPVVPAPPQAQPHGVERRRIPPPALLPDDPHQPVTAPPALQMSLPQPLAPAAPMKPKLRKVLLMATAGLVTGVVAGLVAAAVAQMVG